MPKDEAFKLFGQVQADINNAKLVHSQKMDEAQKNY